MLCKSSTCIKRGCFRLIDERTLVMTNRLASTGGAVTHLPSVNLTICLGHWAGRKCMWAPLTRSNMQYPVVAPYKCWNNKPFILVWDAGAPVRYQVAVKISSVGGRESSKQAPKLIAHNVLANYCQLIQRGATLAYSSHLVWQSEDSKCYVYSAFSPVFRPFILLPKYLTS